MSPRWRQSLFLLYTVLSHRYYSNPTVQCPWSSSYARDEASPSPGSHHNLDAVARVTAWLKLPSPRRPCAVGPSPCSPLLVSRNDMYVHIVCMNTAGPGSAQNNFGHCKLRAKNRRPSEFPILTGDTAMRVFPGISYPSLLFCILLERNELSPFQRESSKIRENVPNCVQKDGDASKNGHSVVSQPGRRL